MISQVVLMIDINQTKNIRFKTSLLKSDLYDFSDAYIVVKEDITLTKTNETEEELLT